MMKKSAFQSCVFALSLMAEIANGHSNPIDLSATGPMGDVIVSGGMADTGFAPMIFADGTVEAQLEHLDVPGYGQVGLTDIPGFILRSSFTDHTIFNMQIIPRPVQGTSPVEERVLWHWSAASQSVALAPNNESLVILSPYDEITLRQTPPGPREVFVTHLEPFDKDQHVHFLRYLLDNSPTAAPGAYGFFARFLVAPHENSDPILVVLNNGLAEQTLLTAARAINAAAADSESLQGDFNGDGTVDAADYVLWRKGATVPSSPQNYAMWRTNFDMASGAATSTFAAVPEPASMVLLVGAALFVTGRRALAGRARRMPC